VFSDILFLLLCYFPSYRKKVVRTNLKNSFPEKTSEELTRIERKFYRHLADLFIETLKLTHLSNKQLIRRLNITNPEMINNAGIKGHDLIVIHSHYNNWEWVTCLLPLYTGFRSVGVYKPLRNKHFDQFLNSLRTRNKGSLSSMSEILREVINNRNNNERAMYGFIADQTPARPYIKYWTTFLNQDTPVHLGAEKIAVKYDMSVVFLNVKKIRRGYYELTIEKLFDHSAGLPDYLITEAHVRRLEEIIRERPEYWLWTHKRWKHKKPAVND